MNRALPVLMALACALAWPAQAEISVSVTISGEVDEILPILEHLKQLGAGAGGAAEDPLKLQVHSVMEGGATPETAPVDTVPPAPAPVLGNAALEPATVTTGLPVLITVQVLDEQRQVDTITATFEGANFSVDVYDNGMNGDATPGDATWSANALVPAEMPGGDYVVSFAAYGMNGEVLSVTGPDGAAQPVQTSITAKVARPEAAQETPAAPAE